MPMTEMSPDRTSVPPPLAWRMNAWTEKSLSSSSGIDVPTNWNAPESGLAWSQ